VGMLLEPYLVEMRAKILRSINTNHMKSLRSHDILTG
ncbi:hypothetical protein D039_2725B, partial [Vibrio parahaemolyticus EKP-028]